MTFEETEKIAYLALATVALAANNGANMSDELLSAALACGEFVEDKYETEEEVNEMILKTIEDYLDLKAQKDETRETF